MKTRILTGLLASVLLPMTVAAQVPDNVARLSILPGWTEADGQQVAGLQIKLAPGWKTYWRAPGDAGIPPLISFAGSENLANAQLVWPTPQVFDQSGMRSIGYHDLVVIPMYLTRTDQDAPLYLRGTVQLGVCQDICIPMTLAFDVDIPQNGMRNGAILAALFDQPLPARDAGLTDAFCRVQPNSDGMTLTAMLDLPHTGGEEVVVVETGDPNLWVSQADVVRVGPQLTATIDMVHTTQDSFALDRSAIRITVLGAQKAVDIRGCPGD